MISIIRIVQCLLIANRTNSLFPAKVARTILTLIDYDDWMETDNPMEKLKNKYPEDNDAASLFSEALMNTMPWNYWLDEGKAKPDTKKVLETLEFVLARNPDHPLAIHLYIHAVEASDAPERAEPYADKLGSLVPGSGHLVHMPSHIFWRVGRYHDASESNIAAAKVDEEYIAQCNAQGFYPAAYYPHKNHRILRDVLKGMSP